MLVKYKKTKENVTNAKKIDRYVEWLIATKCNYDCSYCATKELRKKYFNSGLCDPLSNLPKFFLGQWHFLLTSSGEPFLAPNFFNIVKNLVARDYQISVITNFSATEKDILKFCEITGERLVALRASLHLEYVRLDDFFKKIFVVKDLIGAKLKVRSVAIEGQVERLIKIGQTFRDKGINFHLQLREKADNSRKIFYTDYSKKEMALIKNFNKRFSDKNELKLKGKLCWAGSKYLILTGNGDVWRCWPALIHGERGGYLGNIPRGSLRLKNKPDVCQFEYCNCFFPKIAGMVLDR